MINEEELTITEDFVSFELAKAVKEKGFNARCYFIYRDDGMLFYCATHRAQPMTNKEIDEDNEKNPNFKLYECTCPTIQMVMKWLRDIHNLNIEPYRTACGYLYTITNIPYGTTLYDNHQAFDGDDKDSGQWTKWELACEDAIKYCIEHLIDQ